MAGQRAGSATRACSAASVSTADCAKIQGCSIGTSLDAGENLAETVKLSGAKVDGLQVIAEKISEISDRFNIGKMAYSNTETVPGTRGFSSAIR